LHSLSRPEIIGVNYGKNKELTKVIKTMKDQNELLWVHYSKLIDIYKFYLDITLKANILYYAITGGILTFIFSGKGTDKFVILSLLLPIGMGLSLSYIFLKGYILYSDIIKEIEELKKKLGLDAVPNTVILRHALLSSIILFLVAVVGMGLLIWMVFFLNMKIGFVRC
jgi:hypothetical protein